MDYLENKKLSAIILDVVAKRRPERCSIRLTDPLSGNAFDSTLNGKKNFEGGGGGRVMTSLTILDSHWILPLLTIAITTLE